MTYVTVPARTVLDRVEEQLERNERARKLKHEANILALMVEFRPFLVLPKRRRTREEAERNYTVGDILSDKDLADIPFDRRRHDLNRLRIAAQKAMLLNGADAEVHVDSSDMALL